MARGRRAPPRNSNTMLSIMVVQALTQFMKLERKPPVTVALILINALIFFRPGDLVEIVPSVAEVKDLKSMMGPTREATPGSIFPCEGLSSLASVLRIAASVLRPLFNPSTTQRSPCPTISLGRKRFPQYLSVGSSFRRQWCRGLKGSVIVQLHRMKPLEVGFIVDKLLKRFQGSLEQVPRMRLPQNRDCKRLLLSAFMHADEAHLIYNMVSFLWKGVQLEGALGSAQFAKLIALLTLLSQGCTLLVAKLIADQLGIREPFYHQCAVGFSGVIFALKVVLTWHSPTSSTIAGFIIPTRYAAWAELVAIQYATPQASFVGHLGGILAGLILVYFPRILPRSLPFVVGLRALAPTTVASVQTGRVEEQQAPRRRTPWFSSWGTAGSGDADGRERGNAGPGQTGTHEGLGLGAALGSFFSNWINSRSTQVKWSCPACTFRNRGEAEFCEMCGEARLITSGMHRRTPSSAQQRDASEGCEGVSPAEDIRRRRLERFGKTSTARR